MNVYLVNIQILLIRMYVCKKVHNHIPNMPVNASKIISKKLRVFA